MSNHPVMKTVHSLIDQDQSKVLQVTFGSRKVNPGDKVPKGVFLCCIINFKVFIPGSVTDVPGVLTEAKEAPKLAWPAAPTGKKFMVFNLDLDAPFPSFSPMSPILHWLQTGLMADGAGELTSSDPVIAFWAAPGPPPISSPHRYVFLVYEHPAEFEAKAHIKANGWGVRDRMRWDQAKFEKEIELGPAVAATYFLSN